MEGSAASVIQTDENGETRISVLAPPEVGFHYELSFFKSGNTSVNVQGEPGRIPLARFLMMCSGEEENTTTFQLHAPQKGSYLLDLFAAVYPNYEQCQADEPIKYVNIARFRVDCR